MVSDGNSPIQLPTRDAAHVPARLPHEMRRAGQRGGVFGRGPTHPAAPPLLQRIRRRRLYQLAQ